jgi:RNA polymerase sigma-70 factor (ECF subfamily)
MASLDTFQNLRPRLLSVAYRMLGSSADAQDVLQDAWFRWSATDEVAVRDPKAWLSVTVVRLCLDKLKSVRNQRAAYTGTWLPEPVLTEQPIDRESISLAFLVLLERLTPVERAVYLLHQVFESTHAEIAEILAMTDAAVRQTFHRAKEHVTAQKPRFAPSEQEHAALLRAFGFALAAGNVAELTRLLAADATLWADGGGKVRGAAVRAIHGRDKIIKFFMSLREMSRAEPAQTAEIQTVNGWPALVLARSGAVYAVVTIETDGHHVLAVRNVVNPDKLGLAAVD